MARVGFIHDKLDIKFLVLYIMSRVVAPIDMPTLADLTMCDEGVDYFAFAEAVHELVDTEHLVLEEDRYAITDKGRKNGAICESSLPYSIRVKCDRNVAKLNSRLRRDAQVRSERVPRGDGTFTLVMALDDEHGNLLTIEMLAATEQQCDRLSEQFKAHPEQIYNGVLDVLLTEKSLFCEQNGILFTCMADGEKLSFIEDGDLYCLFGNIVDNALEAVKALPDREQRVINLLVRSQGDLLLVQAENYFAGSLEFKDGLPVTTKADRTSHGFGLHSIRLIARKYGGVLTTGARGNVFHLNILFGADTPD